MTELLRSIQLPPSSTTTTTTAATTRPNVSLQACVESLTSIK